MMLDGLKTWRQVDGVIDFAVAESARILSRLRSVRAASDMITSASDTLHDLLGQIETTGSQSETTGLLAGARGSVQDSANELEGLSAQELVEHLNGAIRHMNELKFIAMMIKIDTADPSNASIDSNAFAADLVALVGTLDETTKTARQHVEPIQPKISEAYQTLHETAFSLTQQVEEMTSLADSIAVLKQARDTQMSALGQAARQVSCDTAMQISRLVPRLQFADAFVQRVQNAQRFIEGADQHPETPSHLVFAVASLQMKALRDDTHVEREASATTLDALLRATSQSAELLSEKDTSDEFGEWLQASASAVALNTQVIETSRRELLSAFQHIEDAHAVAAQVNDTISKFEPLAQTLKYTAINGSLIAAKSSSNKSASYVLTAEIQSVGKKCGQRMTESAAALLNINDVLSRVDRSKLEEKIKQLANSLENAGVAQGSLRDLTRELHETRHHLSEGVAALMEACQAARQTIQDGEVMLQDLESLIVADGSSDIVGIDASALQWITAYYTTEPERALHQRLFGGMADPVPETLEDDDDLGDFLL